MRTGRIVSYFVFVVMVASGGPASAQPGDPTAFSVLRLEPSARIAALAGAANALGQNDPSTPFLNPALIGHGMHRMLAVSYLNHLSDINAAFLSYVSDVGKLGTLLAGLRHLSYGRFERSDENGFLDGTTFGSYESVVTIGLARNGGERLRYGASLNALLSGIDDQSASAFAVDAGVYYYIEGQRLGVSASIQNLGWVIDSFGQQSDELPLDLRVGAAKRLTHLPLMMTVMGYELHDWSGPYNGLLDHVAFGGEFYAGTVLRLRIGYSHRRHSQLQTDSRLDLAGVGLGFGIDVTRFRFDYAYNDWSALGGVHHLTVQTRL